MLLFGGILRPIMKRHRLSQRKFVVGRFPAAHGPRIVLELGIWIFFGAWILELGSFHSVSGYRFLQIQNHPAHLRPGS